MFTKNKKEIFILIHEELDAIIEKIVKAKSEYGEYPFAYGSHIWSYDDGDFEIEADINTCSGYCDESETRWLTITWEEIFDVDNIIENLKKESKERKRKFEIKKKKKISQEKIDKLKNQRAIYEELKLKFEKP